MLTRNLLTLVFLLFTHEAVAQGQEEKSAVSTYYNMLVGKNEVQYDILMKDVIERVKQDYVESVTDKMLYEAAIEGMLSSLDPHSTFLNEREFQDMRASTKGEFGGLGMEVTMEKGFVKVISPYEDSPAFKAGVKVGDFITMIDGQVVKGLSLTQAVDKLRGKPRTKVKITIYRENTNESFDLLLTREIVKLIPVKSKLVGNSEVALIKISSFSETTAALARKEFFKLAEQAREKKSELRGIVLDLRYNPGGLLDQSREVAELFMENGTIVSTKGRIPEANQVYTANGHDISEGLPIVVLINGGSASASEIVAGALQDNKRALVVGTKSFGKGSVQTVMPLAGGTAMKLTTSRYYTPNGHSIQANGITPDVIVEDAVITPVKNPFKTSEASLNKHLAKEPDLTTKSLNQPQQQNQVEPTIASLSQIKETEDYQLLRAIDIVKGMALYSERLSH